jgi:hypothetical protein
MAELVDALVSNTSGSNAVPVRSRLRVLFKTQKALINQDIEALLFEPAVDDVDFMKINRCYNL